MPEIIVGATISEDHQPPEEAKEDEQQVPLPSRVRQTLGCHDIPRSHSTTALIMRVRCCAKRRDANHSPSRVNRGSPNGLRPKFENFNSP